MEVSKADFARMAGVSKAAISKKSKNKRLIVNSAGFIDTDNPINRMYLEKHQRAAQVKALNADIPASLAAPAMPVTFGAIPGALPAVVTDAHDVTGATMPEQTQTGATPAAQPTPASSARRTSAGNIAVGAGYATDANKMLNMTLRELLQNYNGLDGVEKYAKILKDLMAADERAQRIQERRQLQIPKDFVISRLFGYLNQQNNRLLDLPEAMADQVIALAQTGAAQAATQTGATMPEQAIQTGATQATQTGATMPEQATPEQTIEQLANAALNGDTQSSQLTAENRVPLNDTRQKIVNYLRDNITRCIGGAKQAVISELKTLQAKYSENDDTQNQLQDIYEAINEN